jgi:hypothetical protein
MVYVSSFVIHRYHDRIHAIVETVRVRPAPWDRVTWTAHFTTWMLATVVVAVIPSA